MPMPIYRLMFSDAFAWGFPPREWALEVHLKLLAEDAPGLDASTADVVARDFARREQDYAARSEAEGFDMPDTQDVLQESYAEVSADIDAAFAQLEAAEGQEAVASADLDEARRQALVAYVNTSRATRTSRKTPTAP